MFTEVHTLAATTNFKQ